MRNCQVNLRTKKRIVTSFDLPSSSVSCQHLTFLLNLVEAIWCWCSTTPQGCRNKIFIVLLCFIPYLITACVFRPLVICGVLSACWRTCTGEEAFTGFHRNQAPCVFWGGNAAGTPSPRRKALWAADSQCSAAGHTALLSVILPQTVSVSVCEQYHLNQGWGLAPVDPVTDSCHVPLLCS